MADPKRSQGTPEKGGRKNDDRSKTDPARKGDRNPEPHKKGGSGVERERRRV